MKSIGTVFALLTLVSAVHAAPECLIDQRETLPGESGPRLVEVLSGAAKGFASGPIYVSVSNGTRSFTTLADKNGKWAIVYADTVPHTEVLCWQ